MYLSKNKTKIIKTADKVPVKKNQRLFFLDPSFEISSAPISEFVVDYWNDGITSSFPGDRKKEYFPVRGYQSGAAIHPKSEHFSWNNFFLAKNCYSTLEAARKALNKKAAKIAKSYQEIAESAWTLEAIAY